jgi:amidase
MPTVTADLVRLYVGSDALGLAELVRGGQVTPAELTEVAIGLIEQIDPTLNAVVIRDFERARARARLAPSSGAFAGVPFLLKNIGSCCEGLPLTAGLAYQKDFVPAIDSEMVRRIKAAGLIILGRTNVPENGWCIATEPRLYGPTLNPWNPAVTPGGSSGGAAAAVAARLVTIAEATDGGGSIRVPASCCGLVGLKPSRGRITYGPDEVDVWLGSVAFFAVSRTVRDTAAFLDATAGTMPGDPYTPPQPEGSWLAALDDRPRHLRIGVTLTTPWGPAFDPAVTAAIEAMADQLRDLGHDVVEHPFRADLEGPWASYNRINAVQSVLGFDRLAAVLGRPVDRAELNGVNRALVERGRSMPATAYAKAADTIRKANQAIQTELQPFDVFVTPTLTQLPRPVGYWTMEEPDLDRYLATWTDAAFMFAFNISGLPALSVPTAWTEANVPVGVQFVGRYGDEATILHLAAQVEDARPWKSRRPGLCAA